MNKTTEIIIYFSILTSVVGYYFYKNRNIKNPYI